MNISKLKHFTLLTVSTLIMAVGTYFFKFTNNFTFGGITGLAVLVAKTGKISASDFSFIMNMLLLLLGFFVLGKKFAAKTAYCSILLSVALSVLERVCPMTHPLTDQTMLELCFAIALPALGSAILFNIGSSSGKKRADSLTNKEQDTLKDMKLVQEMYARGLEFMPIDLYRAKAKDFQIIDGKLMPSFASIDGMGDKAAEAVELAAKDGKYLSLDDFRQRTKVSKTVIDLMSDLGLFGDLPQSNQLSLFDF